VTGMSTHRNRAHDHRHPNDDGSLDDMIADSFPASDAPSWPSLTLGSPEPRPRARQPYFLPAPPLLRVLPLARHVSQRTHVGVDVALALLAGATALFARSRRGRVVAGALAGAALAVAATTDTTVTAAHLVPTRAHEAFDHAWGMSAAAAPVVLGYARKDPILAAVQIACGAASIAVALVTDYRTARARA